MRASRTFLDTVTTSFKTGLQEAENDLIEFQNDANVVAPDVEAEQLLEHLGFLQQFQLEALSLLGVAQAELAGLKAELERLRPGLAQQLSSPDDRIIEGLKVEIANLQVRKDQIYAKNPALRGEGTPQVAEIDQQIRELSRDLEERVNRYLSSLNTAGLGGSGAGRPYSGELGDKVGSIGSSTGKLESLRRVGRQPENLWNCAHCRTWGEPLP